MQVGSYELGVVPDMFVYGPELVVYGDRSSYAENGRGTVKGSIDESVLQDLLRGADSLPAATPVGEAPSDGVPLVLVVGEHRWKLNDQTVEPFATYLAEVRASVDAGADRTWAPWRWVSRAYGDDTCRVTEQSGGNGSYEAPVYPHVVEQFPLGELDCSGAGAVDLSVQLSCLDTHVWMMDAEQTLAVGRARGEGAGNVRVPQQPDGSVSGSVCTWHGVQRRS
ncbi:MAG: hypothetical protein HY828_20590 [Actinobacteria bacterium]|nr:hypothetical protein [Actinomycetota bacterium]